MYGEAVSEGSYALSGFEYSDQFSESASPITPGTSFVQSPTRSTTSHNNNGNHYNNNNYSHSGQPMSPSRDGHEPPHPPISPQHQASGSPPRSSNDYSGKARRRESLQEQRTMPTFQNEAGSVVDEVVQPGFDESILRALCDLECGVPLLLDRIKQSMVSCREASLFFKKRAVIEDEYGRNMQKLSRTTKEVYAMNDGKAGTFVSAWLSTMKIHEIMAENRIKFSQRLNEMSEELASLVREVEKNRKHTKELAARYERTLQDSELAMEKCKARFDSTAEELERLLVVKEGESIKDTGVQPRNSGPGVGGKRAIGKAVAKGGLLLKGKNPANIQRQEDDIRSRMSAASDAFRKAVLETQSLRQEYFNFQLPRILRSLKECADEIDLGTQYHLSRYAFLFETAALHDGSTLAPMGIEDGPGIKPLIESIDNRSDFKNYMQNYVVAHGSYRGPKREGPWEHGFLPPLPQHQQPQEKIVDISAKRSTGSAPSVDSRASGGRPTFGVDLSEQMIRDMVEVPKVVEKCCTAIEDYGLEIVGIYRLSGTTSKIQKLKGLLERDVDSVNLNTDEWRSDININNVTSVLKLWLRELPEPLLTFNLYQGFIDAAKIENDRLRHIRLHERVNDLPDPNYATLKYMMGHLNKVREKEGINQMTVSNLSIVFGPTLLGPPPLQNGASMNGSGDLNGGGTLQDMNWQCKAVETILNHYADIFVDENETS